MANAKGVQQQLQGSHSELLPHSVTGTLMHFCVCMCVCVCVHLFLPICHSQPACAKVCFTWLKSVIFRWFHQHIHWIGSNVCVCVLFFISLSLSLSLCSFFPSLFSSIDTDTCSCTNEWVKKKSAHITCRYSFNVLCCCCVLNDSTTTKKKVKQAKKANERRKGKEITNYRNKFPLCNCT